MKFNRILSILLALAVVFTTVFSAAVFNVSAEDIPVVQVETFESGATSCYSLNYYKFVTEENGNNAPVMDFNVQYAFPVIRFNNIVLKPNTTYTYSFQYKAVGGYSVNKGFKFLACKDATAWTFYFEKTADSDTEKNLIGTATNDKGYRTSTIGLSNTNGVWQNCTGSFNTGSVVDDTYKYLGAFMQTNSPNWQLYIDDIVITEVKDEAATTGNIVTNVAGKTDITYGVSNYKPAALEDPKFENWCTDKDATVPYSGTVAANTTVMLYPAYGDGPAPAMVELFNDEKSLYDSYGIAKAENGAAHFKIDNSVYNMIGCRFENLNLLKNTDYTLNFKIKGKIPVVNKGPYIIAAQDVDSWKYWTSGAENMMQYNLLGTETDGNTGFHTEKLALSAEENKWTQISVAFNTGNIVTDSNKQLGIIMQAGEGKNYDFYIDDIVLTPKSDSVGNLVLNDGFDNLSYVKNTATATLDVPTVVTDKEFKGWYIDKDLTVKFDGNVPAGTTTMVYAGYGEAETAERFNYGLRDVQTGGEYEYEILTETDGNKYLHATSSKDWCRVILRFKKLVLKPNTKYIVNYRYKCEGSTAVVHGACWSAGRDVNNWMFWTGGKEKIFEYNMLGSDVDENGYRTGKFGFNQAKNWVEAAAVIDTTGVVDDTWKYLTLIFQCSEKKTYDFSFDDISINEISEEDLGKSLVNGDFENGKSFWNDTNGVAKVTTEDKYDGEAALSVSGGYMSKITQSMFLEKNTNYKLNFYYKGYGSGTENWAITRLSPSTSKDFLMYSGTFPMKENEVKEWTQVTVNFNSGDNDLVYFFLQSDEGCNFLVDGVSVEQTTDPADPMTTYSAPVASEYEMCRYDGCQRTTVYVCDEKDNLLGTTGFEKDGAWAQDSLLGSGKLSAVKTDLAYNGDYALRFESYGGDKSSWDTMYFNVEPNTVYYLFAYMRMDKWSKKDKNDMRMAFIDPYTGTAVSKTTAFNDPQLISAGPDEEWHMIRAMVTTGSHNIIGIGFSGAASGGYIDDLMFFKAYNAKSIIPATYDTAMKECSVNGGENLNVAKKDCNDSDNLIADSTFEGKTYWQNVYGYGDVKYGGGMKIADTEGSHGLALHCVEDLRFTGYAKQNYMRQDFSVEPNTNYTVHFDYLVSKKGAGEVGLYANNKFYPEKFLTYKFNDPGVSNNVWNDVSVTFNTNDYDSIVFYVMNGGGEAWIDNVRLFKASAGKLEGEGQHDLPTEITSDSLAINDGILSGLNEGMTVRDILNKLNEKDNIIVTKNGEVVPETEYDKPFTYDMEFKLVDGISYVDSLALYVNGDTNKDYKFDAVDPQYLLKIIAKKVTLSNYASVSADVDGYEGITIGDAVKMYQSINLGDDLN